MSSGTSPALHYNSDGEVEALPDTNDVGDLLEDTQQVNSLKVIAPRPLSHLPLFSRASKRILTIGKRTGKSHLQR